MNPIIFVIPVILIFVVMLSISLFKIQKIKKLTKNGRHMKARFVKQEQSSSMRNNVHGHYIFVQADDGVIYKSNKTFNIFAKTYLEDNIFNVYVDKQDPDDYYVEIDAEPIHQKMMIPFISEAKLRKQGNIINAKGIYMTSHIISNKDRQNTQYFYLFVQESGGLGRVFRSKKIYRKPPMNWFQEHTFVVYINTLDERKYFVDDQVPTMGETILKGVGEATEFIKSHRNVGY